jgi:hypothetical protein
VCSEAVPAMNKQEVLRDKQHETGQSVLAPTVNSISANNMYRVITLVQQIMTEFRDAESEEAKKIVIAKLVCYITTLHDH